VMRTRYAGSLRASDAGTRVELCGWVARRRDHGKVVFLDVRDVEGIVQVVVDPSAAGLEGAHQLRSEWVVRIAGEVRLRPGDTTNPDLPTGEVEVAADSLVVLNESEALPFQLDQPEVDEALRLRYRYLDLRRPKMASNLRLRARMVSAIRRSMDDQGFLEIETPTLTRSTPEGARDFLVPSRLHPGSFYALPQSPQLFKQLLMVGGLDRYYQVAHCWRDEDLRADRQPEFTQLDAEMSFGSDEDVMAFIEVAVRAAITAVTGKELGPLPRLTWAEAMSRYGSDKPDIRFGMELVELTSLFADTGFQAFAGKRVVGIQVPDRGDATRKELDAWTERVRSLGAAGLVWLRVKEPETPDDPAIDGPAVKFLTPGELGGLRSLLAAAPGDLLLLVADADVRKAQTVLGALRLDLGRPERIDDPLALLWVVNFPLFEALGDDGKPIPAHHPFTTPHPDDVDLIDSDPLTVRSLAYDLVINGIELGSGSVRIHDRQLQQKIFGLLGIDEERAQERFGFLLDAFRYGAPPHAGFAFGIDRLAMVLAGEGSLREVIAFPKTQSGSDPLTEAPAPVDDVQLRDLGITHAKRPPRT
jgi:aspartyl-tRNA synthetase